MSGCECPDPGAGRSFTCQRHRCRKNHRLWELCRGKPEYFLAWEEGRGPGQRNSPGASTPGPVAPPPVYECPAIAGPCPAVRLNRMNLYCIADLFTLDGQCGAEKRARACVLLADRVAGNAPPCQRQTGRINHARVHFLGYPGDLGGANTECWHLVKLWRWAGIGVRLTPTWRSDPVWEARLRSIGAETVSQKPRELRFPAGSIVVGMCNSHFVGQAWGLREAGHRLVYLPCMNFTSDPELRYLLAGGRMDAWVFQSLYQMGQWQSTLDQFGESGRARIIRGAFDPDQFPLNPRAHREGEPFVVGRLSRPDPAKFHPRTWDLYGRIPNVQARVMAWNQHVEKRLSPPPPWAEVLAPRGEPAREFLASLHCLVQLNDQAVENWPRAGLEAMAAGVPVVADRRGGWLEMIEHKVSGYLVDSIDEAAYYATLLARDRQQRIGIILEARKRVEDLSRPAPIAAAWESLFEELRCATSTP